MLRQDFAAINVPAARTTDLITTASNDEVLVYDQAVHHIHHLNPIATAVWQLCDGTRTVSDLAKAASVDEATVRLTLRKLEDANLLDGPLSADMRGTQSRRAFMKKATMAGAAVPLIASVSAPSASASHSNGHKCNGHTCTPNTTGTCPGGRNCPANGCCNG